MRIFRLQLLFACTFLAVSVSARQSTTNQTTSDPQAVALLQKSLAVLTGGAPVTDVTLTGAVTNSIITAGQTAGASAASGGTGTVTFIATVSGQSRLTITTTSGTQTEVRDISSGTPTLTEIDTEGATYSVTTRSALSPHPAWFYPAFVLQSGLSSPYYASSYAGTETRDGAAVQHVVVWLLSDASFTQEDIYLDPTSLLPVALTFNFHPYDPTDPNGTPAPFRGNVIDSQENVTFSDYRQVQGRPVAFQILTSFQAGSRTITSDIQISSVTFNTGATVAIPN